MKRLFAGCKAAMLTVAHSRACRPHPNKEARRLVKRTTSRLVLMSGLLTLLFALIQPVAANATATITPHTGTWSITAVGVHTQSTAKYATHTTASTCFKSDLLQSAKYYVQLIWYNGGRNTVLWTSGTYDTSGVRHCSPTKTISGAHNPLVFDAIHLVCVSPVPVCQGNGTYTIDTN
jgi:hypothetical protein